VIHAFKSIFPDKMRNQELQKIKEDDEEDKKRAKILVG
jgi:hypothetical protein